MSRRSELAQRLIVAGIGIPLAVGILYAGGWLMAGVLAAVAAAVAREFLLLAERVGSRPFVGAGAALAGAYVLLAGSAPHDPAGLAWRYWALTVAATLALFLATIWLRGPDGGPAGAASTTLAGGLLAGATLAFLVHLRYLPTPSEADPAAVGAALAAYPMTVAWMNDTFAFFGGRRWGRRKLIPSVSPGKTVAGAVSGVVGGALVSALFAMLLLDAWLGVRLGVAEAVTFGVVIAAFGQSGDLAESVLKRSAGVKDSGTLLPGHGGAFDRLDSILVTAPVAYLLLVLLLPAG
ncbi:MAG: phosphatidate cytidylyltransferase [Gemmatimonadota bacterium]